VLFSQEQLRPDCSGQGLDLPDLVREFWEKCPQSHRPIFDKYKHSIPAAFTASWQICLNLVQLRNYAGTVPFRKINK